MLINEEGNGSVPFYRSFPLAKLRHSDKVQNFFIEMDLRDKEQVLQVTGYRLQVASSRLMSHPTFCHPLFMFDPGYKVCNRLPGKKQQPPKE